MNDKPTENVVNNLPIITKFIYSIGVLPASYKMSMSYEEQVVWLCNYLETTIIPAVNQNGEAVEELQNLYELLRTYVNDYFDNLDVQEEINNKLENMMSDGSLEEIISTYIQPRIDAQNQLISQINNKVDSATSGSPLVATSTSGMIDTSRIYVNTTDGYWYYYNGSAWTQGGVYQSSNLGNNAVHYQNLDDELQSSIGSIEDPTDINTLYDGICDNTGAIVSTSSTGLKHYEFSVNAFDTYKIHTRFDDSIFASNIPVIQFLNNSTLVSNIMKTDVSIVDNYVTKIITIPYGVNKIRINTRYFAGKPYLNDYILKVNSYEVNNISKRQLDSTLQSFFKNQYTEVTPTLFCPHAYMNSGDTYAYASGDIYSLNVNPHEIYRVSMTQIEANPIILFLTNNATFTKTLNDNEYTFNSFVEYIQDSQSRHVFTNYIFEIPDYCEKIYINKWNNQYGDVFKIEKCTSYKINESDIISDTNKVGFEKLIAIGDSITEVNFRALHNYLYWIGQDIPSLTIQNLGAGGTGYYNGGALNNPFVNRINSISSYDLSTDVVLVMGSVNDVNSVPSHLGELGDTTQDTIYGAMYNFFNTLFTEFNGVRVGCVSPINWKYGASSVANLNKYLKALEETCELFKVPYLDIHDITNLRPENDTFLNEYYEADGTGNNGEIDSSGIHPNSKGHHLFYARIKDFINRL